MNKAVSTPMRLAAAGIVIMSLGIVLTGTASADERSDGRRDAGAPYRAQHWIYDDRYHHGHYYPTIGYSVAALPPGYLALGFSNRRFFFEGGVWFAPSAGGFVVVRPPVGIVVPVLPPSYTTVWVEGAPYYYANDTYYSAVSGGYMVAAPPAETTYTEAPAPQAPAAAPVPQAAPPANAPTQSNGGTWYYCDSAQAYYPYVSECKEGWRPVPASPAQPR